jgi:Glycosyl transferase family 2
MPIDEEVKPTAVETKRRLLPVCVIIPVRNESRNLGRCLRSIRDTGEIYVIDSQSSDETVEIARSFGAHVVQFHYHGGWPKKRQWALENLPLFYEWVLLLDADEALTPELTEEIQEAIQNPRVNGYYVSLQMNFLGRTLRHGDATFNKLALFRRGLGRFECRLPNQDNSMADMEVHEHVIVDGPTAKLKNPLSHQNHDSIARYIEKHNEYSNWECRVLLSDESPASVPARLFGNQAQRRRWLKRSLFRLPGSPVLLFLYRYLIRLGFLDGGPGLLYCSFQAIQMFHTKAKIYELRAGHSPANSAAAIENSSC